MTGMVGVWWHVIFSLCPMCVFCQDVTSGSMSVVDRWDTMEETLGRRIMDAYSNVPSVVLAGDLMDSPEKNCVVDLLRLNGGIRKMKTWAFQMVDAIGTSFDGILSGNSAVFGDYQQCLDTVVYNDSNVREKIEVFRGKYCSIDVQLVMVPKQSSDHQNRLPPDLEEFTKKDSVMAKMANMTIYRRPGKWGLCLPSSCSESTINNTINFFARLLLLDMRVSRCEVWKPMVLDSLQRAIVCVLCVMVFLAVIATIVHLVLSVRHIPKDNIWLQLLQSHSVVKNSRLIFSIDPTTNTSCIHGLRFFSMAWIILCHSYHKVNYLLTDVSSSDKDFLIQSVFSSRLAVATLFLTGALQLSQHMVNCLMIKKERFSWRDHIFHRYWRLTPCHLVVIAITFLPFFGSGPMADDMMKSRSGNCQGTWWWNLLYIHNFQDPSQMCLPWTWFLAVDFQLYLISLVILLLLARNKTAGLLVNSICVTACLVASAVVAYVTSSPSGHNHNQQYFLPHSHMPEYGVGLLLGYFLVTKEKFVIKPVYNVLGWIMTGTCMLTSLYLWTNGGSHHLAENTLYTTCYGFFWSLSVGWVLLMCLSGHASLINRLLSWEGWTPLGKLTFTTYLLHVILQDYLHGKSLLVPSHRYLGVVAYFSFLVTSYVAAFALSVLVEYPSLSWEKILRRTHLKRTVDLSTTDSSTV